MRTDRYKQRKDAAIYRNTEPTLTDQSSAKDTDVNVIMKTYAIHGQAPGTNKQPMHGVDFTELPNDLREFIETGRTLNEHMARLPKELRDLTAEQLFALTPEQLKDKLTPAPKEPPEEPVK